MQQCTGVIAITDDHHAVGGGDREDRVARDAGAIGAGDRVARATAPRDALREQQRVGTQRR